MLKEKRSFNVGDKIIVFGCQDDVGFKYEIGTILRKNYNDSSSILIEFNFTHPDFHRGSGVGKTNQCYNISNNMEEKYRGVTFYEYDEEELKNELEEFAKRYSLDVIGRARECICEDCDDCCDCVFRPVEKIVGCYYLSIYYSQKIVYDSYVNMMKEELEKQKKREEDSWTC